VNLVCFALQNKFNKIYCLEVVIQYDMAIMFIPIGSQYVKKEDGNELFINHIRGLIIAGLVYTGMSIYLMYILSSGLTNLSSFIQNAGNYSFFGTVFEVIGIFLYWLMAFKLFLNSDYKRAFFTNLKRYKNDEMIKTSKLISSKNINILMFSYIIPMIIGVVFYVLPIFLITNSY
jgi:hypothetical protein